MSARYSRNQGYTIASKRRRTNRPVVRSVQRKLTFGPTTAKYFGLAVLAILAIIMLTRSSASSGDVYASLNLTKQISDTQSQIDEVKLEAEREQSLQAVQNTPVQASMVPMTGVGYVEKGQVAGVSTEAP